MDKVGKKVAVLAIICGMSALLLGFLNSYTEPIIAATAAREKEEALSELSGGYQLNSSAEVVNRGAIKELYYLTEGDETAGFILNLSGKGYGGSMVILAAYKSSGDIIAVKLMDNSETPGLGKKAEGDGYMDKFIGRGAETAVPTAKEDVVESVDTVTGSTITFQGIANALLEGAEFVKEGRFR